MGGVCDIPAIADVCQTVGSGVVSLVAAPFEWLAHTLGAAAAWFFQAVWAVFDTTTLVDVTGGQYVQVYNLLFGVALFVIAWVVAVMIWKYGRIEEKWSAGLGA